MPTNAQERAKTALQQAEARDTGSGPPAKKRMTLIEALNDRDQLEQIQRALPMGMDVQRFTRICLTAVRTSPQLQQCSVPSLLAACMQAAQLGLEPGILGQSYLVPFWNRHAPSLTDPDKSGAYDVQLIIGYQGYVELFYRSDRVVDVIAREVCENDDFEFAWGIEDHLMHRPAKKGRGDPELYYCIIRLKDGGRIVHVMNLEEIAERRARSRAQDGPWKTDPIPMSRKTLIRAVVPFVPKTTQLRDAVAVDESIPLHIDPNMAALEVHRPDVIDVGESEAADSGGDTQPEDSPATDDDPS